MKDYNWNTIEKYFAGDLTPSELAAFETLLKNGKDFKEVVELYQDIENTLTSRVTNMQEENDLRNTLEDLGKIHIKKETTKTAKVFKLKPYIKYVVAASLVLFATLFYLNNSNTGLYADFAKHPNLDLVVRGNTNAHEVNAQKAFNAKNYALAEQELSILLAADSTKVELQLYLAISLMEQNKFVLAESILEKIKNGNSIYKNKAIWNLALCKLKQKDFKACKQILKTLPKEAEDYETAQKLLHKL